MSCALVRTKGGKRERRWKNEGVFFLIIFIFYYLETINTNRLVLLSLYFVCSSHFLFLPPSLHSTKGNLVSREQLEELKSLAPNVHVVRGDMDDPPSASSSSLPSSSSTFPETKVVTIGELRLGLCHGHQVLPWGDEAALGMLARELDVDVLITGHTHKHQVSERGGKWFLNPGSISGAYSSFEGGGEGGEVIPSFILLAVQGKKVMCYVYEEKEPGEVEVSKVEFIKGQPAAAAAGAGAAEAGR